MIDYSKVLEEFEAHARGVAPAEACGLVYLHRGKPRLYVCENGAEDPQNDFLISAEQFAAADELGDVVGVVHSHPGGPAAASPADQAGHAASGLAWWILALPEEGPAEVLHLPAADPLPLIGRPFVHGTIDCFSLIRDWYWRERGIRLPDFERPDDWWHKGLDLYRENYAAAGFVALPDGTATQAGDILLMNIGANVCNHGAVLVADNVILHHLHGRLSCTEVYTGFYRDRTRLRLRYSDDQADG